MYTFCSLKKMIFFTWEKKEELFKCSTRIWKEVIIKNDLMKGRTDKRKKLTKKLIMSRRKCLFVAFFFYQNSYEWMWICYQYIHCMEGNNNNKEAHCMKQILWNLHINCLEDHRNVTYVLCELRLRLLWAVLMNFSFIFADKKRMKRWSGE